MNVARQERTESCQGPCDPHGLPESKHRPASLCRLDDQVLDSLAGGLHICDDVFLRKMESARSGEVTEATASEDKTHEVGKDGFDCRDLL